MQWQPIEKHLGKTIRTFSLNLCKRLLEKVEISQNLRNYFCVIQRSTKFNYMVSPVKNNNDNYEN